MFNVTKRQIVKIATSMIVTSAAMSATEAAVSAISDETDNEIPRYVTVGGGLVACFVLTSHTDAMVDRVADWRLARKEKKNQTAEVASV